ncbi:MAG: TAXI family TRAP transporter solute-binding subunit [Bacillota bacterium]|nr:TAXI family TRAP transporter solute-binding subunit [Bacillota bacterium]
MRIKRNMLVLVILMTAIVLAASGCGSSGDESERPQTIMHSHISGPTASGWYPMSVLFSDIWMDEIPGMNITVVEGGAIGNIREVNRGVDAQSGFAFASDLADAINGNGVFEGDVQENVLAIAALYPTWWQFAVLDKSPIKSLDDFVKSGGYVIPGNPGDASELATRRVLEAMGYGEEELAQHGVRVAYGGYGDAANQLRDGIIDMVTQGGSPNVPGLAEVDASNPIRLLPIPEDVLKKIDEKGYGYTTTMPHPAGTYKNQTEDVPTIVTMSINVVNKNMDEEVVYQMTKSLWESLDRIKEEQPARGTWMEPSIGYSGINNPDFFHPGALRYYREIGVAK